MLKVTIKKEAEAEVWELEGKLSGDWVKELERCWNERSTSGLVGVQVHLKAVSYIDASGKQLLITMHGGGAQIRGCGCMTTAVVEEILRNGTNN